MSQTQLWRNYSLWWIDSVIYRTTTTGILVWSEAWNGHLHTTNGFHLSKLAFICPTEFDCQIYSVSDHLILLSLWKKIRWAACEEAFISLDSDLLLSVFAWLPPLPVLVSSNAHFKVTPCHSLEPFLVLWYSGHGWIGWLVFILPQG